MGRGSHLLESLESARASALAGAPSLERPQRLFDLLSLVLLIAHVKGGR